ncbi:Leucine Rich Repeat family protein, protein [Aphelenchoides besseyi]|nr:Leucine Rich Repeat family protein, protein [Aphelenchoides besseyi]
MDMDKPTVDLLLETDRLVQLAANVIIRNSSNLLLMPRLEESHDCGNAVEYIEQELRQQDVEAIFEESKRFRHIFDPNFFLYFIEGERYPTSILPIGENLVADTTFVRILIGQAKTLREVDLCGNKSIGSPLLLELLDRYKHLLPKLTSLSVSNQWLFETYNDTAIFDHSHEAKSFDRNENRLYYPSMEIPQAKDALKTNVQNESNSISFTSYFSELTEFKITNIDGFNNAYETRAEFMCRVLQPLRSLKTLEINHWCHMTSMSFLLPLKDTLTTLILYNIADIEAGLDTIAQMENLEHLDISQGRLQNGIFIRPVSTLYRLVSSLRKLSYLDISNTNLCASPVTDDRPERLGNVDTDVYGLNGLHKKLDFLSVFHCEHVSPSTVLPAHKVCSDLSEPQLLIALETYMNRVELLQITLNELYQQYRTNSEEGSASSIVIFVNYSDGLRLILEALTKHKYHRAVQISGTAAIFYIIRSVNMEPPVKRRVVEVMLDAVENFCDEQITVRNCCLSFCQIDVPKDVAFVYCRMVKLLVRILNNHCADPTTPRVVTYLLNSMACHVEGLHKIQVGTYGAIDAVVDHIRRKVLRSLCDEVLEISWSFLWNVTDETPSNCELFLKAGGMELFRMCYAEFPQRKDLIRNMMGLIGNIAEVDYLRHSLMSDSLIRIFIDLLDSLHDGIETSYNSAGVLAQLLSDGVEKWSDCTVARDEVTERIVATTIRWNMDSRRFINYRSFRPILRLLPIFESYGSQIWALWALANLTTTDGPKYCMFIVKENGLSLLHDLQKDPRSTNAIKSLVDRILQNIARCGEMSEPVTDDCI